MQPSREPASHEPKPDESNLSLRFVEFRYWHIGELSPRLLGTLRLTRRPTRLVVIARNLPSQVDSESTGHCQINQKTVEGLTLNDGQVACQVIAE